MDKYRPLLKKLGEEASRAAKKGEENLVILSKMARLQIEARVIRRWVYIGD